MTQPHDLTPERFLELLRETQSMVDDRLREKFDRSLPFQDAAFDRWERARKLGFGDGASIYQSACVFGDVQVGNGTWIGPYVILEGAGGGIRIGSTCSISSGVQVYTHDTVAWALTGGRMKGRTGAVSIGDCTYIGSQSIVSAGVTIGARCVIAANSFISRDVPDGSIVAGSPARQVGRVEFRDDVPVLVYDSGSETVLRD